VDADQSALQARVRQVINETGLTHVQFADDIRLDADKLSKSLNGVRRFTSYELAVIAERGRTTVDWLLTGRTPEKIAVAARAQERSAGSPLSHAIARAEEVAGVHEILQRLDLVGPDLPVLPTASTRGLAIEVGPRMAEAALRILRESTPLEELLKDPAEVIERALGISVLIEPFGEGFDGLSWATSAFRLAIVNSQIPWSRQRFTLFHECGHIIAGDRTDGKILCIDGDVMGAPGRIEEMRANAFAAAALMPEEDVRDQAPQPMNTGAFARMVGRYRVSPDALAWRLKSLGLVDTTERAGLGAMPISEAAIQGGWISEYQELTRNQSRSRFPVALADEAVTAFIKGTIGARPLAMLLHVEPSLLWQIRSGIDTSSAAQTDDQAVFVP
jgi:Zn-dependent peptidase ImmA (M78 family)